MLIQNQKHICENCGKGVQYAHLVSFSKNRSNHMRKPNLHTVRVQVLAATPTAPAIVERFRLCTDCLKMAPRPHKIAMAEKAKLAELAAAKTSAKAEKISK